MNKYINIILMINLNNNKFNGPPLKKNKIQWTLFIHIIPYKMEKKITN